MIRSLTGVASMSLKPASIRWRVMVSAPCAKSYIATPGLPKSTITLSSSGIAPVSVCLRTPGISPIITYFEMRARSIMEIRYLRKEKYVISSVSIFVM